MDRQTYGRKDGQTGRQTDTIRNTDTYIAIDRQKDREINKHIALLVDRQSE